MCIEAESLADADQFRNTQQSFINFARKEAITPAISTDNNSSPAFNCEVEEVKKQLTTIMQEGDYKGKAKRAKLTDGFDLQTKYIGS